MNEKRPDSLGRDGRLRRFQRSMKRRFRLMRAGLRGVAMNSNGRDSGRVNGVASGVDDLFNRVNRRWARPLEVPFWNRVLRVEGVVRLE